ncbi:MAG: response regulator transcription factor [Armatimonadetes bacterium]|nr:response regulator transcription factor [Armatimonadota bacterium]
MPIRVVVVDDHPVILRGLKGMLRDLDGIEVVGEATDGTQAVSVIQEIVPDVALIDVRLPGLNGLEAMRRVKDTHPGVKVVFITVSDSDLYLVEALRWGASGYITKDSSRELIGDAIHAATRGGCVISEALLTKSFGALARSATGLGTPSAEGELPPLVELTPRELDVLRLVSKGMTNRSICQDLCLAEVTVKKHVQSILSKMGVKDRTQAALQAVRLGMID